MLVNYQAAPQVPYLKQAHASVPIPDCMFQTIYFRYFHSWRYMYMYEQERSVTENLAYTLTTLTVYIHNL